MADRSADEYKNIKFYAENTKAKQAGFSKFNIEKDFYFCRYIDGDIAMLSQTYTSAAGRDNGIESVKKNEKLASRYKFESRGAKGHGFALKAGNGQEVAISPNYASLARAEQVSARLTGKAKAKSKKPAAPKVKTAAKPKVKKVSAPKPVAKAAFSGKDKRVENYKRLAFYKMHGGKTDGFNSFEKNGAYYFHFNEAGKIILISESYTSKAGRDNGIASVQKNMKLKTAYQHHQHKNGKYYFDMHAANRQKIATSRLYFQEAVALQDAAILRGEKAKPRTANTEQNYLPLAAYRKATKGKSKGFETFKGEDGEYYFTYFENGKLALISEGYPTAAIRDKGQAAVEKNMKIENRYVFGKGAGGQEGFILRAGNHKEIARSVGYGSAAAATVGAAYLMGTRRRVKPAAARPAPVKKATTPVKAAKVKPEAKPAPKKVKKKAKPIAPLAAGSVAVAGLGAAAAAKSSPVKKAATPVKAAKVKPATKPKTVKKKAKPIVPLAAGSVAVAGLAATAAAAKSKAVKKAAVPVKAAPIKPALAKPKPAPVAAPIAAAAVGTAAIAGAAAIAAAPKAAVTPKAKPVVAAAIPAATPAAAGGGGIWGWLKWLLLALIALLAMLFLFKACAGNGKAAKVQPVATTTKTAAPAALVACWNGSKAKNEEACPAKITCWDNSFATRQSACPVQPVAKDFECWDGSMAIDQAGCPVEIVAKAAAGTTITSPAPRLNVAGTTSVSDRICGTSPKALFNVTSLSPKSVSYLGSNPQFGESLSLTPDGFYRKLATAHLTYANDRAFLNLLARSLGYGSFDDMDASMFSNDTLANGTSGLLGFGSQHALQLSTLNVTDATNLEAFKVRSANGTDVHFMKRCGNYMYVCQP